MSSFKETYNRIMAENALSEEEYVPYEDAFSRLTELLCEANSHMNLTAIRDIPGIVALHYADCLLCRRHTGGKGNLIDIGAGGGFPSLPLAITAPEMQITSLDSTAKKLRFISETADAMSLSNITTLCARAEDAGRGELRGKYDVCTARAVAALNILVELCLPLLKVGGRFVAQKGAAAGEEIAVAKSGCEKLGGVIAENIEYMLVTPSGEQKRFVVIIEKVRETPIKYPRNYSQISKNPL